MIFYGDQGPIEGWPPHNGVPYKPMPTAICRVCTTDGIVIAADGLESSSFGRPKNDHLQKIFPIQNLPLAYAIFGSTGMNNSRDKDFFSLIEEARKSIDALRGKEFYDLPLYAEHFAMPIQKKLLAVMREGKSTTYPCLPEEGQPGYTIAHVFFFGYYREIAWTVDVRFFHRNHELSPPSITSEGMQVGYPPWTRGFSLVSKALFDSDDARLAPYRKSFPPDPKNLTLGKASEIAKSFIEACRSPEGWAIDRDASTTVL